MKKATTLDEQIELYKNRGCELDMPMEEIKKFLSNIDYYRLGFYAFPFEETYPSKEKRSRQYKNGTKFSEIVALYEFDFELRMILRKYISRIETSFKAKLIYFVSNQYKNTPNWFVDNKVMAEKYIRDFDEKIYNPIKANHETIRRYGDKYAPAWKTLNYATFGNITATYESLQEKTIREKIACEYNIRNEKIMLNYIIVMKNLRNMLSHDGVVFDYNLEEALRDGTVLKTNNKNKCKLHSAILVMKYLLESISEKLPQRLECEIKSVLDMLKNDETLKLAIENSVGCS
ncbi:MAG: Abi family protein [Chitinivibrionia bacterium]|nr:Abi family protein [Chitinivibrionia bacterium]